MYSDRNWCATNREENVLLKHVQKQGKTVLQVTKIRNITVQDKDYILTKQCIKSRNFNETVWTFSLYFGEQMLIIIKHF